MSDNNQDRSIALIDELHSLAHSGAFKNMDEEALGHINDFMRSFLNVKVTYDNVSDMTGMSKKNIISNVLRKVPSNKGFKNYRLIPWDTIKRILPHKKQDLK